MPEEPSRMAVRLTRGHNAGVNQFESGCVEATEMERCNGVHASGYLASIQSGPSRACRLGCLPVKRFD